MSDSPRPSANWDVAGRAWGLDMGRAVAALLVVLYHVTAVINSAKYAGQAPFAGFFDCGHVGVDFFFVLSGFVMVYVHAGDLGQPGVISRFAWKRFLRVFPPHWAATLLVVPAYLLRPDFGRGDELSWLRVVASITLLPVGVEPILPVAWSLVFEVWFYLLFGIALLGRAWAVGAALMVFLFPFLGWIFFTPMSPAYYFVGSAHHWQFLFGAMAAWLWRATTPGRHSWLAVFFGALGFFGFALGFTWFLVPPANVARILVMASFASIALWGLASWRGRIPSGVNWLHRLGAPSFAIYLTHYPLISLGAKVIYAVPIGRQLPLEVVLLILTILAVGGGILFHRRVERPLLRHLSDWSRAAGGGSLGLTPGGSQVRTSAIKLSPPE